MIVFRISNADNSRIVIKQYISSSFCQGGTNIDLSVHVDLKTVLLQI